MKNKGIFCLEGQWYGDHRDRTSVYPVLSLINGYNNLPFIHHRCATVAEFAYSLDRWKTKSFNSKYPILYLAFHGEIGAIKIGKDIITLDELAEMLDTKCKGVVIYFGSCETLDIDKRHLNRFLASTQALAVIGYKKEINWLFSTSFDLLIFESLLNNPFDSIGIKKTSKRIAQDYSYFIRTLSFRMVINSTHKFRRKRKIIN